MGKDINYYLSIGLDKAMAEYFAKGRRKIVAVKPNQDFTLTLDFDNGEKRLLDCKPFLKDNTVFESFKSYDNFKRVYLDDTNVVSWDIDPSVDSNVVWNNKIDICPDVCYVNSKPLN